jgi:hypothetical protein
MVTKRMIWYMPVLIMLLTCISGSSVYAGTNLIKNPGFEQGSTAWTFVNHNVRDVRGEITEVEYHSGLKAASIVAPSTPRIYSSWYQHVAVTEETLPDYVSVWYRAPDNDCEVILVHKSRDEAGGLAVKGSVRLPLKKGADWQQASMKLNFPPDTRYIVIEMRVSKQGKYLFDDIVLERRAEDVSYNRPYRFLFVGIDHNQMSSSSSMPSLWVDALKKKGWENVSSVSWDDLTPKLLKQSRMVAFVGYPSRCELTPKDEAIAELVKEYVEAGGGVMLAQNSDQILDRMTLPFYMAEKLGLNLLYERIISDPAKTVKAGSWEPDVYTYTSGVFGPVAANVGGVLYQSRVDMYTYAGVLPFLPESPWQVVLHAGPNSKSEPYLSGLDDLDKKSRKQGFNGNVPLAGVRELGRGRVAYVGLQSDNIFRRNISSAESRKTAEGFLSKGIGAYKSDLMQFYLNVFDWCSANAANLQAAELKMPKTDGQAAFTTAWKMHRGIIGPRTIYSTGQSTPDEYAAKAKAAGMDFIVFLEDFANLKEDGFNKLKADCRRLSGGGFLAVPGITYQNTDGNNEYAFGNYIKMPSSLLLSSDGKRFKVYKDDPKQRWLKNRSDMWIADLVWLYQSLGFNNCSGWYNFSKNPYPFHDTMGVNTMGIITQENGRTLEKVPEYYGYQARSGQFVWPLALTLMKSADEISLLEKGVYYQNVVGADGCAQLFKLFNTRWARMARNLYPETPPFGMFSITNGPLIELNMPRGDTDVQGDIYNPNLQEWQISMKVSSDAGLQEVLLMDGDTVIRRFLPKGKKVFEYKSALSKERQKYIWAVAKDIHGREAMTRDTDCDSWLMREQQCADRANQLLDSRQVRADGTPFFVGYGGDTAMPDKGPWNARIKPVGCFVFDKKLGVGGRVYDGSPESHSQVFLNPFVVYDGAMPEKVGWSYQLVSGREGAPHERPERLVASSDVLVADRVLDGVYSLDTAGVTHTAYHALFPSKPSKYIESRARVYLYLIKPDGVSAYLWDQEFTALKDIPVSGNKPYVISLGYIEGRNAKERIVVNKGATVDASPFPVKQQQAFNLNKGDYLGLLKSSFGSLVIYSLTDGLVADCGSPYMLGIKPKGNIIKAGTKFRARLLLVGIPNNASDPAAVAAKIISDYGLGKNPSYKVEASQGRVAGQEYLLNLESKNDCFRGRMAGIADLSGNLGATVSRLNDNWAAIFQQQSKANKTRLIPVEKGTGYAVIRADDDAKTLCIGHPIVADRRDAVIALSRTPNWSNWNLEIHNPTNKDMKVNVKHNPAFNGFNFNETLTLAPGTSVFRDLGPVEKS